MAATTEEKTTRSKIIDGVEVWASFYRENPHRFAKDYLGITLRLFQKILLYMMNISNYFCYIAARGQGKSFLLAIFCCIRCILYPGTKIVVVSGTRGQATNILEKIRDELIPKSELLKNEIDNVRISPSKAEIIWKNGSTIKVATASDNSRGMRSNILLVDEYRMVDKSVIDTVLRRFVSSPRMPEYLHKKKYAHLKERNKEIYLSSAYFASHISYQRFRDYAINMMDDTKKFFVCDFPYQLSIAEGLLDAEQVADDMSETDFSETKWSMEMEGFWLGANEDSFFDFTSISNNRKIDYPWLPAEVNAMLGNSKKTVIPSKQAGEIRLLSVDIALMSSKRHQNDASAIFVNSLKPTRTGRYVNNIVYTESFEGAHTADQALRVRRLFDMYDADYIVIDVKGVGFGVADLLVRDIPDPELGDIMPGLSCANNKEWAERCKIPGAQKALWVINASAQFNSDCAVLLRDGFRAGRVRLLTTEYDGEVLLGKIKGYNGLTAEEQLKLQMPYINTTLLISELINLQYETNSNGIKVSTKANRRKDRFSSLSYSVYVANQLELQLNKKKSRSITEDDFAFMYRAPKIK